MATHFSAWWASRNEQEKKPARMIFKMGQNKIIPSFEGLVAGPRHQVRYGPLEQWKESRTAAADAGILCQYDDYQVSCCCRT